MMATTPGSTNSARDEAAARAVHQPADIDGELLRLGARQQQHAVVQRVQEPRSPIQRLSSTRMRCITAICPAGPPKLRARRRRPDRNASANVRRIGAGAAGATVPGRTHRRLAGPGLARPVVRSRRWRRGTSGRTRRRAPSPPPAARGRRSSCATSRATPREGRPPPGQVGPRRVGAAGRSCGQPQSAVSKGRTPRP